MEVDDEVGLFEPAVEPEHWQGGHAGWSLDEQMGKVGEERQGEQSSRSCVHGMSVRVEFSQYE